MSEPDKYFDECNHEGQSFICEPCVAAKLREMGEENERLRSAFDKIIKLQPCQNNGDCFYPMYDGDGNYIGEQNVDPLGVIQGVMQIAQDALDAK